MATIPDTRPPSGDGHEGDDAHRLDPERFAAWLARVREHQRDVIASRGGLFDVEEIDELLASVRGGDN